MAPLPQLQDRGLGLWHLGVPFCSPVRPSVSWVQLSCDGKIGNPLEFPIPTLTRDIGLSEDFEYVMFCGEDNVPTGRHASLIHEGKPRHLCLPPPCRTRTV